MGCGSVADIAPIARSPIQPAAPVVTVAGWEISGARSGSRLDLSDQTARAKVLVKTSPGGLPPVNVTAALGRAVRLADGVLEIGSGPGEWLLLGPPGSAPALMAQAGRPGDNGDVPRAGATVDVTHALACLRLTGRRAPALLAKICAVDLADRASPDGTAFRTSVAKVITDVIRDDTDGGPAYLLLCDRSLGQYLYDSLLDAGAEWRIEVGGFSPESSSDHR
jgi:heterotetrameric sarcosine oxidase gamma subunit